MVRRLDIMKDGRGPEIDVHITWITLHLRLYWGFAEDDWTVTYRNPYENIVEGFWTKSWELLAVAVQVW